MAQVDLKDVTKRFGDTLVIDNCSLTVKEKEFLVLVGPSGCGKSTLLRIIAGLESATSGEVRIGGNQVNHIPPKDRNIAMVFQNYALYPHMNVYKNMSFGLRMRGYDKQEIDSRVREAAKILEVEHLLSRRPAQLSGGQRQRVAMGRAIVRKPEVFLFDEPLSNLDAKLRVQMRLEIKRLHERLETTIIYVTHDQVEAMTLAQRIVVIDNGRIQQIDTPEQIYDRPANRFVAGFIGAPQMNFIPAELRRSDGRLSAAAEVFQMPLDHIAEGTIKEPDGRKVVLGIRPEHFYPERQPDAAFAFEAQTDVIEPLGANTVLFCKAGANLIAVTVPAGFEVGLRQNLKLYVSCAHVKLFDAQSGANLLI